MGLGPSRNAPKLGPEESIDRQSDDLDDIFAPDAQAEIANQRPRAGAATQRLSAQTGASSVRTRLILRRALLRQTRASRQEKEASLAQPLPATGTAFKKQSAPSRVFRRPAALQIAILAVVGGVLCGTALAYFLNQNTGKKSAIERSSVEPSSDIGAQKAPATATSAEEETMPMAVPKESEPQVQSGPMDDDPPALDEPPAPQPARLANAVSPPAQLDASDDRRPVPTVDKSTDLAAEPEVAAEPVTEADPTNLSTRSAALSQPDEQSATASAKSVPPGVETFQDCELCPVMVKVPSSQFAMGSPPTELGHQGNEEPQRLVRIAKPFAIGQFEITFDNWGACVKEGFCHEKLKDEGWGRGTRPAIRVSWEDITKDFLPWLSKKSGHVYRLPSEAEWEYAARAQGRESFSFGSDGDEICAFGNGADQTAKEQNGAGSAAACRDGFAYTAPVGSFRPNQFGLFDMHGNVWEWVEDCWNENYETAPSNSAAWTAGDCSSRVVRGGSWNSDVTNLRSAARGWSDPAGRNRSIGFRVARDL
jgi:formylglycine-generating enzyme required for sulfatase activity